MSNRKAPRVNSQPLRGRCILITRPREQARELTDALRTHGAHVLVMPTIKIVEPETWTEIDRSIERLAEYDWIIFTSRNAVEYFCRRCSFDRPPSRLHLCAIGPATARALAARGLVADLVPESHTGEGVLAAFPRRLDGVKILFPRGNLARDTVSEGLRRRGARVDDVIVYRTVMGDPPEPRILRSLEAGTVDVVVFTSSSTVENFVRLVGPSNIERWKHRFLVASIGPRTSQTIREQGLTVHIEAPASTGSALVRALVTYFGRR